MNIKDYLKGQFINPPFEDANILTILAKRGIAEDAEHDTISEKSRDLAYADLLMTLVTMFSGGGATKKRGNWSETAAQVSVGINDRLSFTKTARAIYKKYGESISYTMKDITNRW